MDWARLSRQIGSAQALHAAQPDRIAWATSFTVTNWGEADWAKAANATIDDGFVGGAVAVKIWKDVGMVLKDPDGRYVMADDPRLDPVFSALAKQGRTLVAHLGRAAQLLAAGGPDDRRRGIGGDLADESPVPRAAALGDPPTTRPRSRPATGCWSAIRRCESSAATSAVWSTTSTNWRSGWTSTRTSPSISRPASSTCRSSRATRSGRSCVKYQDRIALRHRRSSSAAVRTRTAADPTKRAGAAGHHLRVRRDVVRDRPGSGRWTNVRAGFKSRGVALPAQVLRKIYFENARKWYPGI